MRFNKIKIGILQFLGYYLIGFGVSVLCRTLRISEINKTTIQNLNLSGKNYILAFWHGTMIVPWYLRRDNNFSAIISQSKDGDILSRLLKKWKYDIARGSSSKGGKEALALLVDKALSGKSIAITPDGPRGPKFTMKAGAVVLAKKTSIPFILTGVAYKSKITLNSWDNFEIPKPFSKVTVIYSEPNYVDSKNSYEDTNKIVKKSENMLVEIQLRAERICLN